MATLSETTKGEEKRAAIMDGARAAFLVGGFHATSMQDLFKATATTPGGFYRYFPSKEALIRALAGEAIGRLSSTVIATMGTEPQTVAKALGPVIFTIDRMEQTQGGARLALMIWNEAQRDPEIDKVVGEAIRPMLEAIDRLATSLLKRNIVQHPEAEPRDIAVILGGVLQGYVVQRALFGVDPGAYEIGLSALTQSP